MKMQMLIKMEYFHIKKLKATSLNSDGHLLKTHGLFWIRMGMESLMPMKLQELLEELPFLSRLDKSRVLLTIRKLLIRSNRRLDIISLKKRCRLSMKPLPMSILMEMV